jgi:hypothetical protein
MEEHPLKKYFEEYFYFVEENATDDGKKAYKENEARVNLVITGLKTVCDVCNGWGHIATDK